MQIDYKRAPESPLDQLDALGLVADDERRVTAWIHDLRAIKRLALRGLINKPAAKTAAYRVGIQIEKHTSAKEEL